VKNELKVPPRFFLPGAPSFLRCSDCSQTAPNRLAEGGFPSRARCDRDAKRLVSDKSPFCDNGTFKLDDVVDTFPREVGHLLRGETATNVGLDIPGAHPAGTG